MSFQRPGKWPPINPTEGGSWREATLALALLSRRMVCELAHYVMYPSQRWHRWYPLRPRVTLEPRYAVLGCETPCLAGNTPWLTTRAQVTKCFATLSSKVTGKKAAENYLDVFISPLVTATRRTDQILHVANRLLFVILSCNVFPLRYSNLLGTVLNPTDTSSTVIKKNVNTYSIAT